ncbi:MAG: hypothetical protein ABI758_02910 [Candidatus Woesebacteria bacterium]
MLDLLPGLKTIIEKVGLSDSLNLFSNNTQKNNILNVNINIQPGTDPKALAEVAVEMKKLIRGSEDGFLGVTDKSETTLELIDGYEKSDVDVEQRKFVMSCIPQRDRSLWMSALILRRQFKLMGNKEEVWRIKGDMSRSSSRGKNIANLCTAGYLESHIIPLYEHVVNEKHDEQQFIDIYSMIVSDFPFAVFVSQLRSDTEINAEIVEKIETVGQYGWKMVKVHGIGEENVKKIQRVVLQVQDEKKAEIISTDVDSHRSGGQIIAVTFNLK